MERKTDWNIVIGWIVVILFCLGAWACIIDLCCCSSTCAWIEGGSSAMAFDNTGQIVFRGSVINTGTCPAKNVVVMLQIKNNITKEIVFAIDIPIGEVYPEEIKEYMTPVDNCEWGDDINAVIKFSWSRR